MLKDKDLRSANISVRVTNGDAVTPERLDELLNKAAEIHEIPIETEMDTVQCGGLLNKQLDDCVCLYHPDHRLDYAAYCVKIRREGGYAFVDVSKFGHSKNEHVVNAQNRSRENARRSGLIGQVGSAAWRGAIGLLASKESKGAEERWNLMVQDAIRSVLS